MKAHHYHQHPYPIANRKYTRVMWKVREIKIQIHILLNIKFYINVIFSALLGIATRLGHSGMRVTKLIHILRSLPIICGLFVWEVQEQQYIFSLS